MNKLPDEESILPLENQKIKGKIQHVIAKIPALDEKWVTNRNFGYYTFPPLKQNSGKYSSEAVEEWLEMMSYVLDDIWWLCELPYHKFWSQVVYDKGAMNGIRSFLHLAPLQKLYYKIENDELLSMYKRIKHYVFLFLQRLTRNKESNLHFIGEEKYAEIMTDKNLISISLLFCICTVYGSSEGTNRMIENLFQFNKNMKLDDAVRRTTQLFSWLKKKIKTGYKDMRKSIESCDCEDFDAIFDTYRKCLVTAIQCLTNAAISISSFLSVYKDGCNTFTHHDFEYHIIRTYQKLIFPFYQEIEIIFRATSFDEIRFRLISMLNICRMELLKTFYLCVQYSLKKLSNNREAFDVVHNYAKIMKFALKVHVFMTDFVNTYNIEEITNSITKQSCNVDVTEVESIKESINEFKEKLEINTNKAVNENTNIIVEDLSKLKLDNFNGIVNDICIDFFTEENEEIGSDDETNDSEHSIDDLSSDYDDWSEHEDSDSEYKCYLTDKESEASTSEKNFKNSKNDKDFDDQPGSSGIKKNKDERKPDIGSSIAQIKDILPHFGDGFIVMCLEYYKMDASAVINALLEGNLAPTLKSIDPNLPYVPPEQLKVVESDFKRISSEKNLREFKKQEYSSYNELLNDKKDLEKLRTFYEEYQIVDDNLYDDDVEEDYEENVTGAADADMDTLFEHLKNGSSDVEECEEPIESRPLGRNQIPLDFCENPEITRARAEQKRQATYARRYVYRNKNCSGRSNQETETEQTDRDRHLKNIHKSRNANHSRRYLSDKKRKF